MNTKRIPATPVSQLAHSVSEVGQLANAQRRRECDDGNADGDPCKLNQTYDLECSFSAMLVYMSFCIHVRTYVQQACFRYRCMRMLSSQVGKVLPDLATDCIRRPCNPPFSQHFLLRGLVNLYDAQRIEVFLSVWFSQLWNVFQDYKREEVSPVFHIWVMGR